MIESHEIVWFLDRKGKEIQRITPTGEVTIEEVTVPIVAKLFWELQLQGYRFDDVAKQEIDENTSDGWHTFKELYKYREYYNALLFNEWAKQGIYHVHKSKLHSDGKPCFGGGWFMVMATLPDGQISNHYKIESWDRFHCEEKEQMDPWDGHSPAEALGRMAALIKQQINGL